ncbi:glucose/arabinose dehydrogenase [Microbacteriaceae bacterium SG_E_30_P1]|uniref:Glucose/arabinose dehydrogenase n=1 Tax=Antiquaquibacter oligotrophicus TaxID=2880260 RepID=A0ABT6KL08_9MICO|nr:PQQ-dependent sugar dehydrogenase [Antiquaquibacter oligotrophicus]MDH6179874.1 glucose/arabinose dehydrogenase [Antiquaquibacter oligotrophicus]UDF14365.1 PQQ-dependent sugar dehydrogenase [Antiquaquibacter oligotrophicus]
MPRLLAALSLASAAIVLAGCTGTPEPMPLPTRSAIETPTPTATPEPELPGPVHPSGVTTIATGLSAPWSILRLESGSTLVSERDRGVVREVTSDGQVRDVGAVPGVVPGGEGGLLGLEFIDGNLYTFFTSASDNRIVRFELNGAPGSYALGAGTDILTALPKAGTHNGGRIKLGPDGMLYATAGDASVPDNAQDPNSLGGKILRMTPDGAVPDDNPFPGSYVYSLGHRNPQGIAWDGDGQLWAAELGQNTWDELNLIEPGGNYGWPIVEGQTEDARFRNPVSQWSPADASPSGLAWTRDTFFLAALRGERLWTIITDRGEVMPWFAGEFGRIRDVVPGPDGTVWMITNNTAGKGTPRDGDDKLVQVLLEPVA